MILLIILVIGVILILYGRGNFYLGPLDNVLLALGLIMIAFSVIFFLGICSIPSELEKLKAEQESLPAIRESLQDLREHRNSVAEDSEYILKVQDYRKRVDKYNQRVKFWKEFLKENPVFGLPSWVLPFPHSIRNKIIESVPKLQLLSP